MVKLRAPDIFEWTLPCSTTQLYRMVFLKKVEILDVDLICVFLTPFIYVAVLEEDLVGPNLKC